MFEYIQLIIILISFVTHQPTSHIHDISFGKTIGPHTACFSTLLSSERNHLVCKAEAQLS